ncbi:ATP-dependent DNA helicase [Trichonephila inaurata madagascariensis]|uniref:ATP-dependent DNA helicase n=1 Tax=Trichonephila inaurata madagascariensis TaxID=2747483 RepID=A0A8X7BXR3_9ARAC|nr:ATP-dependent DNA helicase [Trichonephila inaurata madagascariensis]
MFHEHTLGRIYTIHSNNRECYHLRMLLNVVKGLTSFESLKSVNGILYPTYQAACLALGLLEGDNHWCDTLTDASISSSASKLRELFAIILVFCNVSNPSELWDKFKDHFMEDYVRDFQRDYPNADINAHLENLTNRVLFALQDILLFIEIYALVKEEQRQKNIEHIVKMLGLYKKEMYRILLENSKLEGKEANKFLREKIKHAKEALLCDELDKKMNLLHIAETDKNLPAVVFPEQGSKKIHEGYTVP